MSELVEKGLPCEDCGSSDALASYDDGHTYCFSCKALRGGDPKKSAPAKPKGKHAEEIARLLEGSEVRSLPKWKLTQETARFADYRVKAVGPDKGYHLAIYKDKDGTPCFVKVRVVSPEDQKVDFFGVGDQDKVLLLGHEKLGAGGKMVVVTEGEKDYLTGLQLWANRFPVVSLPFGAESSGKAFARTLDKLTRYDHVVLALDMDGPGREGALELARMLPPGKAFIAQFPEKDLHETFIKHGLDAAKRCLHNAEPYAPSGIVDADEVDLRLDEAPQWGHTLPFPEMYEWTYGMKPGQVWVGLAGIGAGKSDWSAQIVAHHIRPTEDGGNGQRAAMFNYESDDEETLRIVLSKIGRHNFTVPEPEDGTPNVFWTREQFDEARSYRREKCGKLFINNHEGIISWASVAERIRYLFHAYGVSLFMVDPVAALVAGESDKNTALDKLFAEAKALAEELGVTIFFWSHLTRPSEGPSHEEGGQVRLSQARGSNSIGMWADVVIGIERNQQAEDEAERCLAHCRMVKVRKAGRNTGKVFAVTYNILSACLEPAARRKPPEDPDDEAPPPVTEKE